MVALELVEVLLPHVQREEEEGVLLVVRDLPTKRHTRQRAARQETRAARQSLQDSAQTRTLDV